MVRDELADARNPDLVETAELLVSEVVTNALVHAGTAIDVAMTVTDRDVRVEVADGSRHLPAVRGYAPAAGTGRGLALLEQMVDDWGVSPNAHGKTVWFRLSKNHQGGSRQHGSRTGEGALPSDVDVHHVVLLNVPTLLCEAWHQHAQTLLREHMLVSLDADPVAAIQVHADAQDALALLAEHIPSPRVGDAPDRLLVDAVQDKVIASEVLVPVPAESVPHFDVLDSTLEQATTMADGDLFLTAPTQPELRALRRWLCREVARQTSGLEASAWTVDHHAAPPTRATPAWDPTAVSSSPEAMVAADDANRILAVSDAALRLLGYDEPARLVGQRILAIIPDRLRQAHLAGFTLHFLNGRDHLLDKTVTVPVLRSDGSERDVDLTVSQQRCDDGRRIFVARLRSRPQIPGTDAPRQGAAT